MKKDKFKKKHNIKTEQEFDKKRQEVVGEVEEKLDAMGQRNEKKAAKWVIENEKEEEKILDEIKAERMYKLSASKKTSNTYIKQVMQILYNKLDELTWKKGYKWYVGWDGKGIVLSVQIKQGDVFKRAFKPCFEPKYDLGACETLTVWAEDLFDYGEGNLETMKTQGGIWLPPKKTSLNL